MLIQFTRKVPPYNAGEQAGFPDKDARRFIALGAATEVAAEAVQPQGYAVEDVPGSPNNRQMTAAPKGRGKAGK